MNFGYRYHQNRKDCYKPSELIVEGLKMLFLAVLGYILTVILFCM